MAYNTDLPPTIARTGQSTYELRDASGNVIQTYNQSSMTHPADWWEDLISYVANNVSGGDKAIHALSDVTLLMNHGDWTYVDER